MSSYCTSMTTRKDTMVTSNTNATSAAMPSRTGQHIQPLVECDAERRLQAVGECDDNVGGPAIQANVVTSQLTSSSSCSTTTRRSLVDVDELSAWSAVVGHAGVDQCQQMSQSGKTIRPRLNAAEQVDRRDVWPNRHSDTQDTSQVQRPRDTAGALRWLQCTGGIANMPADIPFVFRHWDADDDTAWHQYIQHYRTDYTYRRLGVHRGTQMSDSRAARLRLRDAGARYSADVIDSQTPTISHRTQSEPAVKSVGRSGHRSAPASFTHVNRQQVRVVADDDTVAVTTISLQLQPGPQLPAAKSLLRCPAIKIHLNGSIVSSTSASQTVTAGSLLPSVVTECGSTDNRTHQQATSSALASDSQYTFNGRTMRPVPSNGFSIDDRAIVRRKLRKESTSKTLGCQLAPLDGLKTLDLLVHVNCPTGLQSSQLDADQLRHALTAIDYNYHK